MSELEEAMQSADKGIGDLGKAMSDHDQAVRDAVERSHKYAERIESTFESAKTPRDPWANRSLTMRCRTCMWYVRKSVPLNVESIYPLGRCRRHAPTMSGYPVVFETDWCGDHKIDETKT